MDYFPWRRNQSFVVVCFLFVFFFLPMNTFIHTNITQYYDWLALRCCGLNCFGSGVFRLGRVMVTTNSHSHWNRFMHLFKQTKPNHPTIHPSTRLPIVMLEFVFFFSLGLKLLTLYCWWDFYFIFFIEYFSILCHYKI